MPLLNRLDDEIQAPVAVKNVPQVAKQMAEKISSEVISVRQHLNSYGASVEDVARVIGTVMNFSMEDGNKLRAVQIACQLHGLDKGAEDKKNTIVFNLNGENIQVQSMLLGQLIRQE